MFIMTPFIRALSIAIAMLSGAAPALAEIPTIRAAVLQIGTVNWELDTIRRNGFDTAHGFALDVHPYADNGATRVALEGGTADMMVADWIWAARQRAAGKDYVFIPYSRAIGGLVVPADSPAQTLADLKGKKIGIAGGPLDKSWLILRAFAEQELDMDLAAETEQVFAAPPLIFKAGVSGELDGAINFWHFLAMMKAQGMRQLISTEQAALALGLDPNVPLLGYVLKESFVAKNPGIAQALYDASRDAKDMLLSDDAAWEPLRDKMRVQNETQFLTLRDDFRAGIPQRGPIETTSANALLQLMASLGGEKLVGKASAVPDGLFVQIK